MTCDQNDGGVVEYICPVCGLAGHFQSQCSSENPTFEICPCCGTQFGYDNANTLHEELRLRWISSGARWWSNANPAPPGWNAIEQLQAAGLGVEKEGSRWIRIPIGLILGILTLGLVLACVIGLFHPNEKAPVLSIIIPFALLFICLWVLEKCLRLVTGRKNRGGLMSPTTLRVFAVIFLLLPVAGLFTGYYRKMGAVAIFQAVMYFSAFFGLRRLARQREFKVGHNQHR